MLLEILRFLCDKNSSHFVNNQTGTALIYINKTGTALIYINKTGTALIYINQTGTALIYINKKHWKFIILWRPAVSNIFKCNVRGYNFLTGLLSQK